MPKSTTAHPAACRSLVDRLDLEVADDLIGPERVVERNAAIDDRQREVAEDNERVGFDQALAGFAQIPFETPGARFFKPASASSATPLHRRPIPGSASARLARRATFPAAS